MRSKLDEAISKIEKNVEFAFSMISPSIPEIMSQVDDIKYLDSDTRAKVDFIVNYYLKWVDRLIDIVKEDDMKDYLQAAYSPIIEQIYLIYKKEIDQLMMEYPKVFKMTGFEWATWSVLIC